MNIAADDNCRTAFDELKFAKNARFIVYKIQNERIVIQKIGERTQTWDSFLAQLHDNEFRFCVFDFEFTNADNMSKCKLIFVNWNPDTTPIKGRTLYAAAKQNFKKYLDLNTKDFTLSSKGDYTQADMVKQLSK